VTHPFPREGDSLWKRCSMRLSFQLVRCADRCLRAGLKADDREAKALLHLVEQLNKAAAKMESDRPIERDGSTRH
jgi:hypothetical protein